MSHFRTTAHNRPLKIMLRVGLAMVLILGFVLLFARMEKAKTVYEITLDDNTYTVESDSEQMEDVFNEAGLELSASDCVDAKEDKQTDTVQISVTHKQYVTVTCDGDSVSILTDEGETVGQVLDRLNIELGKHDLISKKASAKVESGDSIVINRVKITYKKKTESIPYSKTRQANANMAKGTESVTTAGKNGQTVYTYKLTSIDGAKPTSKLVKTKTTKPVTQVTSYGTRVPAPSLSGLSQSRDYITNIDDEKGTITTVSGSTYSVRRKLTCSATAYTAHAGARTATGRKAAVGVIAVDPRVIPYGSRMYIQTTNGSMLYGIAVAGDCGGGIKGNSIDLYFNTLSQCYSFGRRMCTVYVLG